MKYERPKGSECAPDPQGQAITVTITARVTPFKHDETASMAGILEAVSDAIDGTDVVTGLLELDDPEVYYNFDVISVENVVDLEAQIAHIEEHADKFEDHVGVKQSVRGYFADYGHIPDLYERLCSDLDIKPR